MDRLNRACIQLIGAQRLSDSAGMVTAVVAAIALTLAHFFSLLLRGDYTVVTIVIFFVTPLMSLWIMVTLKPMAEKQTRQKRLQPFKNGPA